MTSPWILSSIGWPAYLTRPSLKSKRSTALGPPVMNSEITAFARGLKCGGFTAYGLSPSGFAAQASPAISAASNPCELSMCASATPLTPPPARHKKSRRDQKYFMLCTASPHVKEFAEVQKNVSEINQGPGFHLLEGKLLFQIRRGSPERVAISAIDLL